MKENIAALMTAESCSQRNRVTAAGHASQAATGPVVASGTLARDADAADLRRVEEQLAKCLEEEDYKGASAAKENIRTLMGAKPCSHRVFY